MSNSKLKKRQTRLFSTLASIEKTDISATKKRKVQHINTIQQSKAALDQTRINSILLELRILVQRCLTEEENVSSSAGGDDDYASSKKGTNDGTDGRVKEEVDALLENLLVARRELLGDQLDNNCDKDDNSDSEDVEKKKDDVDYAKLIQQQQNNTKKSEGDDDESSSTSEEDDEDSSSSSNDESSSNNNSKKNLTKQLQSEYTSLSRQWKTVLNKHHSNLALHSGMSVNSSKFQSRAVDVSFWEQVQSSLEHDLFKLRSTQTTTTHDDGDEDTTNGDGGNRNRLQFDDSKLYQQQLKDFISQSSSSGTSGKTNKRGMTIDPATEAATRLKRAIRKKTGGDDVDLSSLLTSDDPTSTALDSNGLLAAMKKKRASNSNGGSSSVDRRASKGRKIRYTVNPKLVNFTFPVARKEPMISDDVWFKSLFGGVGRS